MHTKDSNHRPPSANSSKALAVDKDKYELVHALVSSAGMPHYNKLSSIYELLSSVAQSARGVVKGTDSQRRFSACFSELCRGALMGLADLEDLVFELRNPGRAASDAADDEVMGISEVAFIKELSAYVASYTPALTAQYLERVGLSVLSKHRNAGSRRGATASSMGMSDSNPNRKKRTRTGGEAALDVNQKRSKQSNQGMPFYDAALRVTEPVSSHHDIRTAFDDLGLLKQNEAMMRSAVTTAASNPNGQSDLALHPKTTADTSPGLSYSSSNTAPCMPPGALSKQTFSVSNNGAKASDLSARQPNLRTIPEFSSYVLPWTMPAPKSVLDRVTLERERHTASVGSAPALGVAADDAHKEPQLQQGLIPTFEVCFAPTPAELLARLEARDAALSSLNFCMPWGHVDDQQGYGRRKKPVPFSTMDPQPANDYASRAEAGDEMERESDAVRRSGKAEHAQGDNFTEKPFFPSSACICNAVPLIFVKDLIFNGVSNIEFIHYP